MPSINGEAASKMLASDSLAKEYRLRAQLIANEDAVVAKYFMDASKAFEGLAVHYKGLAQHGKP